MRPAVVGAATSDSARLPDGWVGGVGVAGAGSCELAFKAARRAPSTIWPQ